MADAVAGSVVAGTTWRARTRLQSIALTSSATATRPSRTDSSWYSVVTAWTASTLRPTASTSPARNRNQRVCLRYHDDAAAMLRSYQCSMPARMSVNSVPTSPATASSFGAQVGRHVVEHRDDLGGGGCPGQERPDGILDVAHERGELVRRDRIAGGGDPVERCAEPGGAERGGCGPQLLDRRGDAGERDVGRGVRGHRSLDRPDRRQRPVDRAARPKARQQRVRELARVDVDRAVEPPPQGRLGHVTGRAHRQVLHVLAGAGALRQLLRRCRRP